MNNYHVFLEIETIKKCKELLERLNVLQSKLYNFDGNRIHKPIKEFSHYLNGFEYQFNEKEKHLSFKNVDEAKEKLRTYFISFGGLTTHKKEVAVLRYTDIEDLVTPQFYLR